MRIKNVVEKAQKVKVNDRYDCSVLECMQLINTYRDEPWDLCYEAFKFGYLQGSKAEKKALKN